jgi:hypothetical protein
VLVRTHVKMEPPLSDIERLLRSSSPQPRAEFVRDLERSLVDSVQPRQRLRFGWVRLPSRRILTGGAFAGAMATLLLVLAIAGVRPFGTGGTSPAQAERKCSTVETRVRERRAVLRVDAQGRPHVTYRVETVLRPVIRCNVD